MFLESKYHVFLSYEKAVYFPFHTESDFSVPWIWNHVFLQFYNSWLSWIFYHNDAKPVPQSLSCNVLIFHYIPRVLKQASMTLVWIITIVNDPSVTFSCGGSFGCHFCFLRCSSQQEKLSLVDDQKHKKENPPTIVCEELKIYAIALYLLFSKKCFLQILMVRWKRLPITITFFFAWWSLATMS